MRPTAILLCGLPFAGKSTLAEAFVADGYVLISIDSINRERGLGLNGDSIPASAWEETHRVALSRLQAYLGAGHNVIWDDTNYAAWIRDPIFEAALEAGAEPVVVFVDTPVDVVKSRAADPKITCRRLPSSPEDFDRVLRDFERPPCGVRVDGTVLSEHSVQTLKEILGRQAVPSA